jgi:hypothetical protein
VTTGFSLLVHGKAKTGKSTLSDTGPAPRLVLDAEGGNGTTWTPSRKTVWDPNTEAPPENDGTWETCIVNVRKFMDVQRAYEWLNSGQHPFRAVTIDSVSETQQRGVDEIAGTNQMQTQNWGELLRRMSKLIRDFRDLVNHPTNPLDVVTFIAMTREVGGMQQPYVQGQLATILPYQVDVVGYLQQVQDFNVPGKLDRFLMFKPDPAYSCGERVGGRLGPWLEVKDHDRTIEQMLDLIFDSKENNR